MLRPSHKANGSGQTRIAITDSVGSTPYPEPRTGELEEVAIDALLPERTVRIGSPIPDDIRERLLGVLRQNIDCFAWSHKDMVGIDESVITHQLNVDPDHPPVRQKRHRFAPETGS